VFKDSFGARTPFLGEAWDFFNTAAVDAIGADTSKLPLSLKILLENLLRHEDGRSVTRDDIVALARWPERRHAEREISFYPARVIMPDSSGVPLIADLSAMRDAMVAGGADPKMVNPVVPVDLIVDHSVLAENTASADAFQKNIELEFEQNRERYVFLKWAQKSYTNLSIVPPASGIIHQVNLEHLAQPVRTAADKGRIAFPDSLVGLDSHTPMVNSLGVFGWGVGGIEAASAILGEPVSMIIPDVIGARLVGRLREGVTGTDLALTIVQKLRAKSVVGKIVEFFGPGLTTLKLPDRATIANMAPEYGATMGFFPIDSETIRYLSETGRPAEAVSLTEKYAKIQGLWAGSGNPQFTDVIEIDLDKIETSLAGPKRPQDRVALADVPGVFTSIFSPDSKSKSQPEELHRADRPMQDGDIIIAAITSCTNTSNPSVMVRAGLLARNAVARGLCSKRWVKTSLSPGSRVVSAYLKKAQLQNHLDQLGFQIAGYGCMTCSGGSGSLAKNISAEIDKSKLKVASVLSGNRNFEGRIHPQAVANFLASPPLVVAYALAGSLLIDLNHDPLGISPNGERVFLRDIWPLDEDVDAIIKQTLTPQLYEREYSSIEHGGSQWINLPADSRATFSWDPASTYLRQPPFLSKSPESAADRSSIRGARILALLGDDITTDHISPGGAISSKSAAGRYLIDQGVAPRDFNNFLARRANHEVMIRGTFGSLQLKNEMAPGWEGAMTEYVPAKEIMTIFEASERYRKDRVPLVVIAGANYGTGSSRDWAAKGPALLGVRAVVAESFERIHRSNLIGMGILPLEFTLGENRKSLRFDGSETLDIFMPSERGRGAVKALISRQNGEKQEIGLICRIDTGLEAEWYANGGVLPHVLAKLLRNNRRQFGAGARQSDL